MDAEAWDERYAATELVWSPGPNQFVEAECAELTPGRALDLAAGEGRNALWLARNGWTVTAVDFSRVALEKGREVAGDVEVEWVVGDAHRLVAGRGVRPGRRGLLQLVADERGAAVRNAFASLAPGGTLLVVAHDTATSPRATAARRTPPCSTPPTTSSATSTARRTTWSAPARGAPGADRGRYGDRTRFAREVGAPGLGTPPNPRPSRASHPRDASQGGGGRRAGGPSTDDNAARRPWGGAQQAAGLGVVA